MANKDSAFGLRAIGKVGQNRDNQGLSEYGIAASSTAIYQGDPIMMAATGKIIVGTAAAVLLGSLNGVFLLMQLQVSQHMLITLTVLTLQQTLLDS